MITVQPHANTLKNVAKMVVAQVVDNFMFTPNTAANQILIHSDIVAVMNILWKDTDFRVVPHFDSFGFTFDFTIDPGTPNAFGFSVKYFWDNSNDFRQEI